MGVFETVGEGPPGMLDIITFLFNADKSTDIEGGDGILLVIHTARLFRRSCDGHHRPRVYDGFDGRR